MKAVVMGIATILVLVIPCARAQAPTLPANAPQATDILPSLKSHMAQLGSLMNVLFRNIDEPERSGELVTVTLEMDALLRRAAAFKPDVVMFQVDAEKEAKALTEFHACIERARAVLAQLRGVLAGNQGREPKYHLLQLDRVRRNCHAAFG